MIVPRVQQIVHARMRSRIGGVEFVAAHRIALYADAEDLAFHTGLYHLEIVASLWTTSTA